MKAVIISCFDKYNYNIRTCFIEHVLKNRGYDVQFLVSDFDHVEKCPYTPSRDNCILLKTMPYKKNISVSRILSHYFFSRSVKRQLQQMDVDLIYVLAPPNFLIQNIAKYANKICIPVVVDLIDLWPESFPLKVDFFPFSVVMKVWANLRNNYIDLASYVIFECELYQKHLECILPTKNKDVLYLVKKDNGYTESYFEHDGITLCYLGSINNIIDIETISNIVRSLKKRKDVTVHVIGRGEKQEEFIKTLEYTDATIIMHGPIYDEREKCNIYEQCDFGINIMKDTVCVGLTTKSIDYLQAGLPLINNIKFDTQELIEKYNAGFNVTIDNIEQVSDKIVKLSFDERTKMKQNARHLYEEHFSEYVFEKKMNVILDKVEKGI